MPKLLTLQHERVEHGLAFRGLGRFLEMYKPMNVASFDAEVHGSYLGIPRVRSSLLWP